MSATSQPPHTQVATLRSRVFMAGGMSMAGQAVAMVLRLGGNLVLARLLGPEAFGLVAVVAVLQVAANMLSDLGVHRCVIQSQRGDEPDYLNTAWTVQIFRGLVLTGLMWLIALGVNVAGQTGWLPQDRIFGDDRLPWLIAVISLATALGGAQSMAAWRAERNLQLGRVVVIELLGQVVALIAMIAVAWWTHSYWALAVGSVLAPVTTRLLEYAWLKGHTHRIARDPQALMEIRDQAKWIMPASALGFFALHSERLIMGGLVDTTSFGFYAIAFLLINSVSTVGNIFATKVVFPSLSEVSRERPHDLPRVLARFHWMYDAIFVSAFAAMAVCGEAVVDVLYDDRYISAGPILMILAVGCIATRSLVVEQSYLAEGKPIYTAVNQLMRMVALIPAMFIGHSMDGLHGAVMGIAAAQFAGWPVVFYYQIHRGLWTWQAHASLVPAVLAGGGMGWLVVQVVAMVSP